MSDSDYYNISSGVGVGGASSDDLHAFPDGRDFFRRHRRVIRPILSLSITLILIAVIWWIAASAHSKSPPKWKPPPVYEVSFTLRVGSSAAGGHNEHNKHNKHNEHNQLNNDPDSYASPNLGASPGLVEPGVAFVDTRKGAMRVEYYSGLTTYIFNETGMSYDIVPVVDKMTCFAKPGPNYNSTGGSTTLKSGEGHARYSGHSGHMGTPLQHVFPDLKHFEIARKDATGVNGVDCDVWEYRRPGKKEGDKDHDKDHDADENGYLGVYRFYVSKGKNKVPIRFSFEGRNVILGTSHFDNYTIDYHHFRDLSEDEAGVEHFWFRPPYTMPCRRSDSNDGPTVYGHRSHAHELSSLFPSDTSENQVSQEYDKFLKQHGKSRPSFSDSTEYDARKNIFMSNIRYINMRNRQGLSYHLAPNRMADWTDEEMKLLRGRNHEHIHQPTRESGCKTHTIKEIKKHKPERLPEVVDWVKKGYVLPAPDQGSCGSCWAFASVGSIEGQIAKHALTPTPSPTTASPVTKSPTTESPTPGKPKTSQPTGSPTKSKTKSPVPSPTDSPTNPKSKSPVPSPTGSPTNSKTKSPVPSPTGSPTNSKTKAPVPSPTGSPTKSKTKAPIPSPTDSPTKSKTKAPVQSPTDSPTKSKTKAPVQSPTDSPTNQKTKSPVPSPTDSPTKSTPAPKPTDKPATDHLAMTSRSLQAQENKEKLVKVSAQNLMDCSWGKPYGNQACGGGLDYMAYRFLLDNNDGKIARESDYPFLNQPGFCRYDLKRNINTLHKGARPAAQLQACFHVTEQWNSTKPLDSKDLVDALNIKLAEIGPISVSINAAPKDFYFYGGGIFDGHCKGDTPAELDHSVLAVGYNLKEGYTVIRNNWGELWGEHGFARIRQKGNVCGVATSPVYVELKE